MLAGAKSAGNVRKTFFKWTVSRRSPRGRDKLMFSETGLVSYRGRKVPERVFAFGLESLRKSKCWLEKEGWSIAECMPEVERW